MAANLCNRIAIGTALLGSDYGIAHLAKKIEPAEFNEIMRLGAKAGATALDTAISYGDSHSVLGALGVTDWDVTTKLPSVYGVSGSLGKWFNDAYGKSSRSEGVGNRYAYDS